MRWMDLVGGARLLQEKIALRGDGGAVPAGEVEDAGTADELLPAGEFVSRVAEWLKQPPAPAPADD
jgi:hypothetical protein